MNRYHFGPTLHCDVIGKLDLKPELCAEEYKSAVECENENLVPPNWDEASDAIEMIIIQNNRENLSFKRLQRELLDYKKRVAIANMRRVHVMYGCQERLRKRFIRVNTFMKECMDKRFAAEQTAKEQHALHLRLTKDISTCKNNIATLTAFRGELKATVKEFQLYERQINKVVKISKIYQSKSDCLNRCDALMLAQVEIFKLKQSKLDEIETMRKNMVKLTTEAALKVLGLKTGLTHLERSYANAYAVLHKQEVLLEKAKKIYTDRVSCNEKTVIAVNFLYELLLKRQGKEQEPHTTDFENQMCFIKKEIDLLRALLLEVNSTDKNKDDDTQNQALAYC